MPIIFEESSGTSAFGLVHTVQSYMKLQLAASDIAAAGAENFYFIWAGANAMKDVMFLSGVLSYGANTTACEFNPGTDFYLKPGDQFKAVGGGNALRHIRLIGRTCTKKEMQEIFGVEQ